MALAIMLNNYFHDLATATFAVSAFAAWRLQVSLEGEAATDRVREVVRSLVKVAWGALAWVILAGVPRALAFRTYEWMEAAGRDQIPVLVAKHIVLVTFVGLGVAILIKIKKRLAREVAALADGS